ncbi:S41 family peptidase [Marivirga atlantica]|jgi:hypothetical protein|uniref:Peptidase S41 n=1 Tax=Marivirga atlantica TaxID=1548457 RepID=A0A937AEL2_9BACT|nr:S41 family peptidase [Marivirga atlantica]MBL0765089.1 peptidase S41 [Marivirga atlantica]
MNKRIYLIIFLLIAGQLKAQDKFSKKVVLEDLAFLKSSLEETHINLYAYTSKEAFEKNYEEVCASITKDSLSLLEATSLFQHVITKVNNGHTEISFPGQAYGAYAYAGGTIFPLEIAFENGKSLIRKNWSDYEDIEIGSEIISINGQSIESILTKIYPYISAEREYFKLAKIELFSFPRLYWQVFGDQNHFEVKIKTDGTTKAYSLKAIDLINGYEMKRTEIITGNKELKFLDKTAYMAIGSFGGDEAEFKSFIDSSFTEIRKKKSQTLIIDLRNNNGGNDSFSDYLVSYIADKPFKWNSTYTLKTSAFLKEHIRQNYDTTQAIWKAALTHKDGEIYPYDFGAYEPQPASKRFKGKVYVLVNRQSYSQSTVTAAQIKDYGFGTIVGEETGEYASLYASIFSYSLPNTGVEVHVPKGHMIRVSGREKEQGVIPDIIIKDHLLDEKDEVLDTLIKKIKEIE